MRQKERAYYEMQAILAERQASQLDERISAHPSMHESYTRAAGIQVELEVTEYLVDHPEIVAAMEQAARQMMAVAA